MKEIGVGDVKDERMARAIGIIVEGYQLARAPAPSEIFSREFLPPHVGAGIDLYGELEASLVDLPASLRAAKRRSNPFFLY